MWRPLFFTTFLIFIGSEDKKLHMSCQDVRGHPCHSSRPKIFSSVKFSFRCPGKRIEGEEGAILVWVHSFFLDRRWSDVTRNLSFRWQWGIMDVWWSGNRWRPMWLLRYSRWFCHFTLRWLRSSILSFPEHAENTLLPRAMTTLSEAQPAGYVEMLFEQSLSSEGPSNFAVILSLEFSNEDQEAATVFLCFGAKEDLWKSGTTWMWLIRTFVCMLAIHEDTWHEWCNYTKNVPLTEKLIWQII